MKLAAILERVMTRLFCGPECWEVQYTISDAQGGTINGVHRTYLPLSGAKNDDQLRYYGKEIAREIGFSARTMLGVAASAVVLHKADQIW